jgi:glycosyltransferase involved in cell wall biosynthesis
MPPITALVHTNNDALRLGRCLETLYACDGVVIVDHASADGTLRIAREYGARVVHAKPGDSFHPSLQFGGPEWILAIEPQESLTESLAASLFAWKREWKTDSSSAISFPAFSVFLREERVGGWAGASAAQTRLVPATWTAWNGNLPIHQPTAIALRGELLRFAFP